MEWGNQNYSVKVPAQESELIEHTGKEKRRFEPPFFMMLSVISCLLSQAFAGHNWL